MQEGELIKEVLELKDLAPEGILLAVIFVLVYYIIKLHKELSQKEISIQELNNERLNDFKENSAQSLEISERLHASLNQIYEVFKHKNNR